uniref:Uncharacterized protein n=1 Tax=Oryza punctata TaxID=4537 RepID=A0A0E0LL59_ORYPU
MSSLRRTRIWASSWSSTTQESHFCLLLSKLNAGAYEWPSSVSPPRAAATPPGLLSAMVYKPFPLEHPLSAFGPATRVCAATCRLVPPTPTDVGAVERRRASAALFLEHFDVHGHGDVVLGGDFSWDDDLDRRAAPAEAWVGGRSDGASRF